MRSRAYSSVGVNQVDAAKLSPDRQGQALVVGMDIGKYQILGVAHWPDGTFEGSIPEKRRRCLPEGLSYLRR